MESEEAVKGSAAGQGQLQLSSTAAARIAADDDDGEEDASYIPVPRGMLTRLLFSNPVCFLVTQNEEHGEGGGWNVMAVSWLSPVDNHSLFTLSLNAGRHSLSNLRRCPFFTLCPATASHREALLAVGSSSGRSSTSSGREEVVHGGESKAKRLGIPLVPPGQGHAGLQATLDSLLAPGPQQRGKRGREDSPASSSSSSPWRGVGGTPAHACCRVLSSLAGPWQEEGSSQDEARGHVILLCEILCAAVQPAYWDGKCFGPVHNSGATTAGSTTAAAHPPPPLLSFLGSKRFANIVPQE